MGSGVAHGLIHQIQAGWHYCRKTAHPSFFLSVAYVLRGIAFRGLCDEARDSDTLNLDKTMIGIGAYVRHQSKINALIKLIWVYYDRK